MHKEVVSNSGACEVRFCSGQQQKKSVVTAGLGASRQVNT